MRGTESSHLKPGAGWRPGITLCITARTCLILQNMFSHLLPISTACPVLVGLLLLQRAPILPEVLRRWALFYFCKVNTVVGWFHALANFCLTSRNKYFTSFRSCLMRSEIGLCNRASQGLRIRQKFKTEHVKYTKHYEN